MTNTFDSFWSPSSEAVIEPHRLRNDEGGVVPRDEVGGENSSPLCAFVVSGYASERWFFSAPFKLPCGPRSFSTVSVSWPGGRRTIPAVSLLALFMSTANTTTVELRPRIPTANTHGRGGNRHRSVWETRSETGAIIQRARVRVVTTTRNERRGGRCPGPWRCKHKLPSVAGLAVYSWTVATRRFI